MILYNEPSYGGGNTHFKLGEMGGKNSRVPRMRKATSIKILPPNKCCAQVYSEERFNGYSAVFCENHQNFWTNNGANNADLRWWNDRIASIRVVPGKKGVYLFE